MDAAHRRPQQRPPGPRRGGHAHRQRRPARSPRSRRDPPRPGRRHVLVGYLGRRQPRGNDCTSDLDGDGAFDIVLGAPQAGGSAGSIYVLASSDGFVGGADRRAGSAAARRPRRGDLRHVDRHVPAGRGAAGVGRRARLRSRQGRCHLARRARLRLHQRPPGAQPLRIRRHDPGPPGAHRRRGRARRRRAAPICSWAAPTAGWGSCTTSARSQCSWAAARSPQPPPSTKRTCSSRTIRGSDGSDGASWCTTSTTTESTSCSCPRAAPAAVRGPTRLPGESPDERPRAHRRTAPPRLGRRQLSGRRPAAPRGGGLADQAVQAAERKAILAIAKGHQLLEGKAAEVVEGWLETRPDDETFTLGRRSCGRLRPPKDGPRCRHARARHRHHRGAVCRRG